MMGNKNTNYDKHNDVSVLSLTTNETLKINPQISRTRVTDSDGEHIGPDEMILVFSIVDPTPIEEREFFNVDPNEPLVVLLESKDQVDHLIEVLERLRFQLYGLDLSSYKIKN